MLETKPSVYKYSKYCKIMRVKIQRNKLHKKIVENIDRPDKPLHFFIILLSLSQDHVVY